MQFQNAVILDSVQDANLKLSSGWWESRFVCGVVHLIFSKIVKEAHTQKKKKQGSLEINRNSHLFSFNKKKNKSDDVVIGPFDNIPAFQDA